MHKCDRQTDHTTEKCAGIDGITCDNNVYFKTVPKITLFLQRYSLTPASAV